MCLERGQKSSVLKAWCYSQVPLTLVPLTEVPFTDVPLTEAVPLTPLV